MKYRRQLLIATRNDTKGRYFKYVKEVCRLKEAIKDKLSEEHYNTIINVTESSREKKFIKTKDKLKNKFELLYASKYKTTSNKVAKEEHLVKNCVLNLADSEIPQNHLDLLNLGPNFAVTPRNIPYMDIITTTEIEALKLASISISGTSKTRSKRNIIHCETTTIELKSTTTVSDQGNKIGSFDRYILIRQR